MRKSNDFLHVLLVALAFKGFQASSQTVHFPLMAVDDVTENHFERLWRFHAFLKRPAAIASVNDQRAHRRL